MRNSIWYVSASILGCRPRYWAYVATCVDWTRYRCACSKLGNCEAYFQPLSVPTPQSTYHARDIHAYLHVFSGCLSLRRNKWQIYVVFQECCGGFFMFIVYLSREKIVCSGYEKTDVCDNFSYFPPYILSRRKWRMSYLIALYNWWPCFGVIRIKDRERSMWARELYFQIYTGSEHRYTYNRSKTIL